VTVLATDLIYPTGLLRSDQFPGESLLDNVTEKWLPEAVAKAADANPDFKVDAVKDWVYYRGFSSIANRLAGEPDTLAMEGVSRTMSNARIQHFTELAESHKKQFLAAFGTSQIIASKSGHTTSVNTRVKF